MKDDTRAELERIEKELLAQEPEMDDILDDALIREVLAEPAFEDMDEIKDPDGPLIYCNYSNDYGRDLELPAQSSENKKANKNDKVEIGLMITASLLALGIICVMIYWLTHFLK